MYFYFPKELVKNSPKGFNMLPISKSEEDPNKFRANLELTPFKNYDKDVIQISDPAFINKDRVVEVCSYLLMSYEDGWLAIEDHSSNTLRAGLLPDLVNRGEEVSAYSMMLNLIRTGEANGPKPMVILGYIIKEDKIIFITRFSCSIMPQFLTKNMDFVLLPKTTLFSEDYFNKNVTCFDKATIEILPELSAVFDKKLK